MSDFNGESEDQAAAAIVAGADPTKAVPNPEAADAAKAEAAAKAQAEIEKANADREAAEAAAAEQVVEGETYQYNPTGDAGLDIALEFIGGLGFSADHAAVKAATTGDFKAITLAMEKLGDKAKGFERYLKLAEAAFAANTKAREAKVKATEEAVYVAVGGKDEWDKIAAFTKTHADANEKAQIEAALAAGGMQAQSIALLLKQAYNKANPRTPSVVREGASGAAAKPGGAMTPQDYADKVRAIRAKTKGPIDNNPEYLALREQFARVSR